MHPVRLLTLSLLMGAAALPVTAGAQLITPNFGTQPLTLRPDLVAVIDRSTIQFKFQTVSVRTVDGNLAETVRPTVPLAVCTGLDVGQSRVVNVPPLRWGVRAISFKSSNGTELRGSGTNVQVRLTYKTITGNLVGEQVVTQVVANVAPGAEQLFAFVHPSRPTTYTVVKFREAVRPAPQIGSGTGLQVGSPSTTASLYCIPSINTVDHAITVNVDPEGRINDLERANNILRIPSP